MVECSECGFESPAESEACKRCKFPFDGSWPSLVDKEASNYRLVRRIGGGGFGAVYEARHVTLNNPFAVKVLDPSLAQEERFIERFQQEAQVMAELRHENVVQVIDFGYNEEVGFFLVTEWLEGRSLFKIWRHVGALEPGWVLALYSQLLDALSTAHAKGIVHRDLKPENLMLTTGSRSRMLIKIVDFGIASMVQKFSDEQEGSALAKKGHVVGTPYYMAPEQIRGQEEKIDGRTDLYACGVMLGELLTGQRIFEGGSYDETMRLHLEAVPPTLYELDPEQDFPEAIQGCFARALCKKQEHRFQSAHDFYAHLEEAMISAEIGPIWEYIYQDLDPKEKAPKQKRPEIQYHVIEEIGQAKRRDTLWGILLGVLVLGLLGYFLLPRLMPKPKPRPRPKVRKRTQAIWLDQDQDAGATKETPAARPKPPDGGTSTEKAPTKEASPKEQGEEKKDATKSKGKKQGAKKSATLWPGARQSVGKMAWVRKWRSVPPLRGNGLLHRGTRRLSAQRDKG